MMTATASRVASVDQFVTIAETLSEAFQNEEAWSFIVPDPVARARVLRRVFKIMIANDYRDGALYVTPQCEAVTLWRAPGHIKGTSLDFLRNLMPFLAALGSNIGRALNVSGAIEAHYPKEPVHYLHFAACHPDHQGKGLGGAAIRAGLAQADAQAVPAYLETATPTNVGLYARLGFEVTAEWDVSPELHFWGMLRQPR
jgi:ribosomal protein S18 acetylase RimI-like enzyme